MELRSDPNYRQLRIYELNRRISAQATAIVDEGVRSGELRKDIPLKLVRDMIFGAIEHQTWAYLRGEGDFSVEESAEGITDVVYRGIAAKVPTVATEKAGDMESVLSRLEKVAQVFEAAEQQPRP